MVFTRDRESLTVRDAFLFTGQPDRGYWHDQRLGARVFVNARAPNRRRWYCRGRFTEPRCEMRHQPNLGAIRPGEGSTQLSEKGDSSRRIG